MGAGQTSQGKELTLTNAAPSFAGVTEKQEEGQPPPISGLYGMTQLPKLARSTTLQWTLLVAALFVGFVVALLSFVYLKTKYDLTMRSDRMIAAQMRVFAQLPPDRRLEATGSVARSSCGTI